MSQAFAASLDRSLSNGYALTEAENFELFATNHARSDALFLVFQADAFRALEARILTSAQVVSMPPTRHIFSKRSLEILRDVLT